VICSELFFVFFAVFVFFWVQARAEVAGFAKPWAKSYTRIDTNGG
jgi:hypothetical protein